MKTKIATALSIAGVLSAGSAAALVNTQILDSGPTESGASNAVLPPASSIELDVPAIQSLATSTTIPATSTSSLPESTTSTTTPTAAVAPAAQPSGYLTAFNVGEAGVVTVDVIDGQLVLVKAEPKPGWSLTKAEDDSNDGTDELENEVEVEFTSPTVRVEFQAEFVDGQIVPHVESQAIPSPTTAPAVAQTPNPAPVTTAAHHDDDDDDDDDEHEREHEHDDDGGEYDDD